MLKSRDEHWVAGVYIRESAISFVVGMVDIPECEDWGKVDRIAGRPIPRTRERPPLPDFEYNPINHATPQDFIRAGAEYLRDSIGKLGKSLDVVHVACFGLIAGDGSLRQIGSYPSVWRDVNVMGAFQEVLSPGGRGPRIETGTHTDAIAFGEYYFEVGGVRKGNGLINPENYTIVSLDFSRTVSMGIVRNGEILHGASTPMVSVIRPRRYTVGLSDGRTWFDLYQGNCEHHKDCIEGLIGSGALADRCDLRDNEFDKIPDNHPVWDVFSYYAAQLCVTVTGILAPNAIVLTGRCIKQLYKEEFPEVLVGKIRAAFYDRLRRADGTLSPSYPDLEDRENFIRLPRTPVRKNKQLKGGYPGRHGAVRRAAASVLSNLEGSVHAAR